MSLSSFSELTVFFPQTSFEPDRNRRNPAKPHPLLLVPVALAAHHACHATDPDKWRMVSSLETLKEAPSKKI